MHDFRRGEFGDTEECRWCGVSTTASHLFKCSKETAGRPNVEDIMKATESMGGYLWQDTPGCSAAPTSPVSSPVVAPPIKTYSIHEDAPGTRIETESGVKYDQEKIPLDLLPFEALEEVAKVLRHGAKKYSAHNWRKGFRWSRLLAAVLRHLFAYARGERIDSESGLPHLAHAAATILFLLTHELNGLGQDDLYISGT